jgi:hypothetical protein
MVRTCTRCDKTKSWDDFYAAVKWEDGTMRRPQSRCKRCMGELSKEYGKRLRRENPEAARQIDRDRWARIRADPERYAVELARVRDWYAQQRRARGAAVRPRCSSRYHEPRPTFDGTAVDVGPLRDWMESTRLGTTALAHLTGLGERTVSGVRHGTMVTLDLSTIDRAFTRAGEPMLDHYPYEFEAA